MNIQEKLQLIQQLEKITQTELAFRLNVSFPTLNSWINGKSQPHAKKQTRIDQLYRKVTHQEVIADDKTEAKKKLIFSRCANKGSLLKRINTRPDLRDQLILSFTYHTNSIEGSTLTENETADVIFRNLTIKNKNLVEHLEAKNHQSAFDYLLRCINSGFVITGEFILELHKILMNSIRQDAGYYRNHGVRIVGANVATANYVKIPTLMQQLVKDINLANDDIIEHAAIIHSRFEKIHPFSDGNGRVGRLILAAMLLKENIAPAVVMQQKKRFYYRSLQKSQQKDMHDELIDFICDCIINGIKLLE